MAYKVFSEELIKEANYISQALAERGGDLYDEKNEDLYDKAGPLVDNCVDHLINELVNFQASAGINHEPLDTYFLIPLSLDESTQRGFKEQGVDLNSILTKSLQDIGSNHGRNRSYAQILSALGGNGSLFDIKDVVASDEQSLKQNLKGFFNGLSKSVKTMELKRAIEDAIEKHDQRPFETRVFANFLENQSDGTIVADCFKNSTLDLKTLGLPGKDDNNKGFGPNLTPPLP
jgi:hypothetical protein